MIVRRLAAVSLLTLSLAASLSACTHHYGGGDDSGNAVPMRDSSGISADSRAAQTPRETCLSGCTRDYNMCMDEASNSREAQYGVGTLPSAGRECADDMRTCQKRCAAL